MAGVSNGDRALIEDVVKLLLAGAPVGWTQLHGEFEPASEPPVGVAHVTTSAGFQPLAVSAGALSVAAEHQRKAAAAGAPWQRLIIDCHADGRLSAHTEPAAANAPAGAAATPRRWPRRVLAGVTVGCLIAAAVVLALGRQWVLPPRAAMVAVAPIPPRQQEAFNVITQWFDAKNGGDVAAMRALACANPTQDIVDTIQAVEHYGVDEQIVFPDGIAEFRDEGSQVWVRFASRIRPLDDHWKAEVADAQKTGGFFDDKFTLVDEDGGLKVCDDELEPR